MASIRTKKTGVIIEDTIATGRRINVQLGQKVSKREQATLLAIYNKYKASLTEDQRKVISGAAIRQYLLAMRQMPDEMADREIVQRLTAPSIKDNRKKWITLTPEFKSWLELSSKAVSPAHQKNRLGFIETLSEFFHQNEIIFYDDLTNEHVLGYESWRQGYRKPTDKRDKSRVISSSAIAHELQVLEKMVDWCVAKKGQQDHKVFFGLSIDHSHDKTIEPFSTSEVDIIFKAMRTLGDDRFHDLALLSYLLGAELKALQWVIDQRENCLDRSINMVRIFKQQVSGVSGGKTDCRGRLIEITPTIERIFERGHVFQITKVNNFVANSFKRKWTGLKLKDQETPDFHFHQFRHSFASHHLSAGVPLEAVSDMMGHADIDITRNTYSKYMLVAGYKGREGMVEAHKTHLLRYEQSYFDQEWSVFELKALSNA